MLTPEVLKKLQVTDAEGRGQTDRKYAPRGEMDTKVYMQIQ